MAEKFGIKETKEVLHFLFSLTQASIDAAADGKFGADDVVKLLQSLTALPSAISGITSVGQELTDLDAAEKAELYKMMVDELKVPNELADLVLKQVWKIVLEFGDFLKLVKK